MNIEPVRFETVLHVAENMRPEDAREIFALRFSDDRAAFARDVAARGPFAWVGGIDKPIAAFGAQECWPGMWEVWMFATPEFDKIGLRLTRFIHDAIVPGLVKCGCRRIQAHSIEGHTVAHRWLETLGAVREAELLDYGANGETFVVYRCRAADAGARGHGPLSVTPLLGGA